MLAKSKLSARLGLASLATALALFSHASHAQTLTANIEVLGVGAESLLGGDLTDPENDGLDELGAATDPSWNWAEITSSHEPDFEGGENSFNIFDNKVGGGNDKWCCDDPIPDAPVWVAVKFKQPIGLTHFTITSGNDTPGRDPVDFAIQGSNDGTTYTDIYHFQNTETPWGDERNRVVKFTLNGNAPAYTYIRYIAYETPANLHQINEIEYFGVIGGGGLPDADKDGMPDQYEVQYGFNPNDPSDAAKDFDGDGVSNLDEYKAGTNPTDTTKPTITAAATTGSFNTITLTFSEDLDPATASNVANYSITPALAVTAASYKSKVVTLTTANQTPGGTLYTINVSGVTDTSKNAVAAGTKATIFSYLQVKSGVLRIAYWTNITGTPVQNLYDDERYPATPSGQGAVFSFNSRDFFPTDSLENYGAVLEGFITPTEAGAYRFFVYSDDASQLFLSTDATEANAVQIAEETGCCNNFTEPDSPRTSEPINLNAGSRYFVRLVYKEGGGGDYGQVAWRKEGDTTPAGSLTPIPSRFLSSAVDLPAPAEGAFTTQSPAANAKNVSPDATIRISHRDGKVAWTADNTSLSINGTVVAETFTKVGDTATFVYKPAALLPSGAVINVSLSHPDPAGAATKTEWSFTVATYTGPLLDKVAGRQVILLGAAKQGDASSGQTGTAADLALDTGVAAGVGYVPDATFLNTATADDSLSVAYFQKLRATRDSSAFWANSTSSPSSTRGFQAHTPWSNNSVYFDTSGCCDADVTRINADISSFVDYTGDVTFWNSWHHFAFVKDGAAKRIYIDGKLFHEGAGDPLKTDFTTLVIGGGPGVNDNRMNGQLDNFTVYGGALTEAQARSLATGAAPSSVPGLIAHWDFNDVAAASVRLIVTRNGGSVTITSEPAALPAGYVLQTASSVTGPWTTVAGTTPATVPIGAGTAFLRATRP